MDTIFTKPKSQKAIDEEIERLAKTLSGMEPEDQNYSKIADNMKVLCEARSMKTESGISTDVVVSAAVNLLGILLVLNHERANVITTKAFGFLGKKM
jgi:hypothetical protein